MTEKRQMFIPKLGTEFRLEEDWTFPLYLDRDNSSLRKALGISQPPRRDFLYHEVTLEKGVTLIVDRTFIRQNPSKANYLTFRIGSVPENVSKEIRKKRFWAKLGDINTIKFSIVSGEPTSVGGFSFILLKKDLGHYQATADGNKTTFSSVEEAKKHIIENRRDADQAYVFRQTPNNDFPIKYKKHRRRRSGAPVYNAKAIESRYELVYKPEGPLGKGNSVSLRRCLYNKKQWGSPKDPKDFFLDNDDREAIEEADSIYALVDDIRAKGRGKTPKASGAVIFRLGTKWQARLTGKMKEEAPSLQKKINDIWGQEDGSIPLRTLSEGVSLLEDFFEENLDVYGVALPNVEDFHARIW